MKNRLKSPVLWSALAALALLAGRLFTGNAAELAPLAENIYRTLLTLVTLLGIVNNPTDQSNF